MQFLVLFGLPAAHHPAISTAGPSYFDPSQKPSTGAGEGQPPADSDAQKQGP